MTKEKIKNKAKPHRLVVKVAGNKRHEEGTISVKKEYSVYRKKHDKSYRMRKKMTVHNEAKTQIPIGTRVEIEACRPISKTKNYRIIKVLTGGASK
jgi:small subunit ribosomal protein S17